MWNKFWIDNKRWISNFIALNSLLYILIGLSFVLNYNGSGNLIAKIFLGIADIGHMGFFPFLLFPFMVLIQLLFRKKSISLWVGGVLSSIGVIFMMVDAMVYAQMRFHLNKFVFNMVFGNSADQIFNFPVWMHLVAVCVILLIIAVQVLFAKISVRKVKKSLSRRLVFIVIIVCLFSNHIVFAISNAVFYHSISQTQRVFPLYFPLTANSLLNNLNLIDRDKLRDRQALNNKSNGSLFYPKKELAFGDAPKYNILVILIDCWRGDCMTPEITPNSAKIAEQSQVFTNHYSGSSGTRSGVFSLFYSLPAFAYWDTMKGLTKGPVFIKSLLSQEYKMGIFASATITNPPFDATVFADVPNLRTNTETEINTPWARDEKSTKEWLNFINNYKETNETKPFFGFLFYDGVHGYSSKTPGEGPFQPAWKEANLLGLNNDSDPTKFFNLYKNVLHEADQRVGLVLNDLEKKGLLDSTIVILSGDHGQEFNDNKHGYWGHGGNYTKAQTHVPLVIHWPNKEAKKYDHKSLHYDLIPTLLSENQGCLNDNDDYAIGKSLFDTLAPKYYVAGAFETYAIVEDDKIITVNYTGNYSITDLHMTVLENQSLDGAKFRQIFKSVNRFYDKE